MPITFSRSYQASDGNCYATLAEAQAVEIATILELAMPSETATMIVEKKDAIICALTINDSSRPKARGQKKPRKAKAGVTETPSLIPEEPKQS